VAKIFQKDGAWYAEFYIRADTGDFERQRKSTRIKVDGTAGAKKRAKVVADEMERTATDPLVRDRKPKHTLSDAKQAKLRALTVRAAPSGTVVRHGTTWKNLLRLLGANTSCAALTPQALIEYADKRKAEGAAHDTYRRELVELGGSIRALGLTPPRMPELPPARIVERWTTSEEIDAICANLEPWKARIVRLVSQTGLRKNEVYSLRRTAAGTGRLIREGEDDQLKTGERTIPLTPIAEAILLDGPVRRWTNAGRDLLRAAELAGLGRITWNDIRAGVATQLLLADVAPARIAALLGHTTLKMVERRYARLKSLKVTADDLAVLHKSAKSGSTEPPVVSSVKPQKSARVAAKRS
jgi:integrase